MPKTREAGIFLSREGPKRVTAPAPGMGWRYGPPRRLKVGTFSRWKTPNGVGALLGVAFFHRAPHQLRNSAMSQLARRDTAPHRAAFITSPSRRFTCRMRGNAPPFLHPALFGEEAPFSSRARRDRPTYALCCTRAIKNTLPRQIQRKGQRGSMLPGKAPSVPQGLADPSRRSGAIPSRRIFITP